MVRLHKSEFIHRFGNDSYAVTEREKGSEPIVYTLGKISVGTRLHEIHHATKSPFLNEIISGTKQRFTAFERMQEELEAEEFTCVIRGKQLKTSNVENAASSLVGEGYSSAQIMGAATKVLDTMGYYWDRKNKHDLWWKIRRESETK